jgi:hypothetical protein
MTVSGDEETIPSLTGNGRDGTHTGPNADGVALDCNEMPAVERVRIDHLPTTG